MNIPKLISTGTCSNSGSIGNKETLSGTSWTVTTCNAECNSSTRSWCTNFFLGTGSKSGECHLYATGCTIGADSDLSYYEKLSIPADTTLEYNAASTLVAQENAFFTYFRNEHSALCNAINSCEIKAAGCSGTYSNGNLAITANTGVVTSVTNNDAGFVDTVCIKCSNAAGSTVTYDNWTVTQKPNCATLTANSMTAKDYAYNTGATGTVVYTFVEAFANTKRTAPGGMPWSVCPITSCEVK